MKYICKRTCYFDGKVYKDNAELNWTRDIVPCPECAGKGCIKCRETGRRSPPHHFEEAEKKEREKEEQVKETIDELQLIKEKLEKLGKPYDKRWGLVKLQNLLTLAEKGV